MRRVLLLALGFAGVAGSAAAEPWIDYELLRRLHADQVVVSTDAEGRESWLLDMGDGVTVRCDEDGCVGTDVEDAVGCTFAIVADLKAFADTCKPPVTDLQRQRLNKLYERIGRFVAANAVPVQTWEDFQGYSDQIAEGYRAEIARQGPALCAEANGPGSALIPMIEALSAPLPAEDAEAFDRMLSRPRLPVMNPCL